MTYSKEALEALDPLVRVLMEALGWDWPGDAGVPSADECLEDVAAAVRERFTVLDAQRWEYVPGWIGTDGRAFVQNGVIAPGYVRQFMSEGGEVLRRHVGDFEAVTAETAPKSAEPEMRCPGCDCDPVGYAPHNGKGDCPPKSNGSGS